MKLMLIKEFRLFVLMLLAVFLSFVVFAVTARAIPSSLVTNEDKSAKSETFTDPYHRESPFGSTQGILDAIQKQDSSLLLLYLDPTFTKQIHDKKQEQQLLSDITQIINQNSKLINIQDISRKPTGKLDDTLPENIEKIGEINVKNTPDMTLKRIDENHGKIWVLSNDFLSNIQQYRKQVKPNWIDNKVPKSLHINVFGYDLAHLLSSLLVMVVALAIGLCLSIFMYAVSSLALSIFSKKIVAFKMVVLPISIICATYIYEYLLIVFEIEWITRELLLSIVNVFNILAIAWLIYRIISLLSIHAKQKTQGANHPVSQSIVFLLTGLAKSGLILFTILLLLHNFNVDVSSGIAFLGLGGLALALGAQKVIENLIGSVVVVADKPVDIGDFCRFGTIMGHVESVGIRSTRIRTLDRTLVTIPNGVFSSVEIENYDKRDKFLFCHLFALDLNNDGSNVEKILINIRKLLSTQKETVITEERVRLRFVERDCIKLEVRCYIVTPDADFELFLEQQEKLLLEIMSIIASSKVQLVNTTLVVNSIE